MDDRNGAGRARLPAARGVTIALAIPLAGLATIGWRWHRYVTAGESPYDEVGIELNSRMPEPLRAWGCVRIQERFPRALPPYGCQPGRV